MEDSGVDMGNATRSITTFVSGTKASWVRVVGLPHAILVRAGTQMATQHSDMQITRLLLMLSGYAYECASIIQESHEKYSLEYWSPTLYCYPSGSVTRCCGGHAACMGPTFSINERITD